MGEVSEVTVSNTGSWSGKLMSRGGDCLNMSLEEDAVDDEVKVHGPGDGGHGGVWCNGRR